MKMDVAEFQHELLNAHVAFYRRTALHWGRLVKGLRGPGSVVLKMRNILSTIKRPRLVLELWKREMEDYLSRPALNHAVARVPAGAAYLSRDLGEKGEKV